MKLVLPCLETWSNLTWDSCAAKVTLLRIRPFHCISQPVTTVSSQHVARGQVQSVTGVERADKKDFQDLITYLIKYQGISMGINTKGPKSGRKEPYFRRYLFSQLLGMLAAENSHLSSSVKVDLCWRDSWSSPHTRTSQFKDTKTLPLSSSQNNLKYPSLPGTNSSML